MTPTNSLKSILPIAFSFKFECRTASTDILNKVHKKKPTSKLFQGCKVARGSTTLQL